MPSLGEAAVLLGTAKRDVYWQKGEATASAKAAVDLCTKLGDKDKMAEASLVEVSALIASGDQPAALKRIDELSAKSSGAVSAKLQLLKVEALVGSRSYGTNPWAVKDAALAITSASAAAKSLEDLGDKKGMGQALLAGAKAKFSMGQEKQSMLDAQKALSVFNELGDESGEAMAWELLSDIRFALNATDSGNAAACAAMSLFLEAGDAFGEARVLLALADQAGKKMPTPAAAAETLAAAAKALAQFQKVGCSKLEVVALDLAVKAQCALGQTFEATQAAKQSIATLHRLGKKKYEGLAMLSLAYAHAVEDWQSEAEEVSNHALQIFKDLGDKLAQAKAYQCIASLSSSSSKLDQALTASETAAALLKEANAGDSALSEATGTLTKIKEVMQKNPGLQAEVESKKKLQREIDLQTLNEAVEALQLRKKEGFKEKYDKINECTTLTDEEIASAFEPVMQVDYDGAQEWISSALKGSNYTHQFIQRGFAYWINRTGGMHYGPAFRLITTFGASTPIEDPMKVTYGVLQLQTEVSEIEWENQMLYHPPMYDCGLQVQIGGMMPQPEIFHWLDHVPTDAKWY
jgi:hypothetical protein